jgi:spermidine/putrescine transport system permease protein
VLLVLLMLPFWISYIIRTMSWINILGVSGALNSALIWIGIIDEPIQMLYNETTVILGLVHFLLPFMVLNVFVSLEGIDTNLEDAANSLGATRWQGFLQVTLPLSLPGLAAGGLLCFVLAAGTYITPVILGGPRDAMFANLVFEAIITQLNWPLGSALSLMLAGGAWRAGADLQPLSRHGTTGEGAGLMGWRLIRIWTQSWSTCSCSCRLRWWCCCRSTPTSSAASQ